MTREELKRHCLKQIAYCEEMTRLGSSGYVMLPSNHRKSYEEHKLVLELLENESRWIPVSERLPEDYETVIASVNHEYVFSDARYSTEYGWEFYGECYWRDLKGVDAWMPLPKAYKPESEEEE